MTTKMIEPVLRSICESRYRWLIVTGLTLVVGLVLLVPLVDVYLADRREKEALSAELEIASNNVGLLDRFEARVSAKLTELEKLEGRAVPEERVAGLRDELVSFARDTNCHVRRLVVGTPQSRPWLVDDDPITPRRDGQKTPETTNFTLEQRPVTISLSGSLMNLRTLLDRLYAQDMFVHTKSFELRPTSVNRKTLTLDMELVYFALVRGGGA